MPRQRKRPAEPDYSEVLRRQTTRVLVIRLFTFVLGPLFAALVVGLLTQRYLSRAVTSAGVAMLINVGLSVRDGVVLERGGSLCDRRREPIAFWFLIVMHAAMALACGIPIVLDVLHP